MQREYFNVDTLPGIADPTGTWTGYGAPPVERKIYYRDYVPEPEAGPVSDETIESVIARFCELAGVDVSYIRSHSTETTCARNRGALVYYLDMIEGLSRERIAEAVGLQSGNTIRSIIRRVKSYRMGPRYDAWITALNPFTKP